MTRLLIRAGIWVGVLLLFLPGNVGAQPADLGSRMAELLRYTGAESPAPEDVARMAELWTRTQQPGISSDERRLAFRDMFVLYSKLHGQEPSSRLAAMENLARFAAGTVEAGGSMDLTLPEPRSAGSARWSAAPGSWARR